MIKFNKLKVKGFKSFVEPTEIIIENGLTGIVGPNGCGKSNLVEAFRFVMGELSPKQMRGSELDDVIFNGTSDRPAWDIAEVTLDLDNSERKAPSIFNQNDKTIPVFHTTPILEQLKTADAVIHIEPHGVGLSTAILESLIMNIPTMNIVIKNEIFQFDCVREHAILTHLDSDDIEKPIFELLFNENVRNDLIKNIKNHLSNCLANPGIASKKFAEILSLLK